MAPAPPDRHRAYGQKELEDKRMAPNRVIPTASLVPLVSVPCGPVRAALFIRGDVDASGQHDISDAVGILGHLFLGGHVGPDCLDALDVDDSGEVEITDGIYLLGYLFLGNSAPL